MRRFTMMLAMMGALPGPALACAVCGGSNDQTAGAFLASTLVLSALPLVMLFGGVWLLWSYNRPTMQRVSARD